MSVVAWIKGRRGANGFGYASSAEEVTDGIDLTGKTVLITGVNSGLGQESARVLGSRGARIVGLARTLDKAAAACQELGPDAVPLACELSDPASVRACVESTKALDTPLDVVLCNAGIMALPKRELVHGHEKQFFTNHVGHFMLVTGLLDALADRARVVVVSSGAHGWAPESGIEFDDLSLESSYTPNRAYGQSKLANLLFARALARRFVGTEKTSNALHPGVIKTNLGRHMSLGIRLISPLVSAIAFKSVAQGAATQCYIAAHPAVGDTSGEYFADCHPARSSRYSRDDEMGERLWDVTEQIIAGL